MKLIELVKERIALSIESKTMSSIKTDAILAHRTISTLNNKTLYNVKYFIRVPTEPKKLAQIKKNYNKNLAPFMPPFAEGLLIFDSKDFHQIFANHAENAKFWANSAHRLLLNKYKVLENHVLITSSEFRPQTDVLSVSDLSAGLTLSVELDGFCFYNAGPKSGRSVEHFHMQAVPWDSLDNFKFIEELSEGTNFCNKENLTNDISVGTIRSFCFSHLLYKFESKSPVVLQKCYLDALRRFSRRKGGSFDYNVIFCQNWLFLAPRKNPSVKVCRKCKTLNCAATQCANQIASVELNSLVFCGSLFCVDDSVAESVKSIGISKLMRDICYD